jgi:AraC-like DNA-binding protein
MARLAMPLASYSVLQTTSVDDARASVAASLAPHRLTPLRAAGFQVSHNTAVLDRLSLHYIDYGTEVEVAVDALDFQLVQIPLAGITRVAAGSRSLTATPRSAVVTGAGEPLRMRYSAGNPRLMVRVSTPFLTERLDLARRVGLVVPREPGLTFDITRGRARSWRSLLDVMLSDLERQAGLALAPLASSALELAMVDSLIASIAGESSGQAQERSPHEGLIKRAARLIDEHCDEPLSTPDIADAIGVSIRTLQTGFRSHLNTTPMAYVRQARLRRVRDLLTDGSATSVTEAALRCGVTHLGRFSLDYRAAFGESPSETLHRSR